MIMEATKRLFVGNLPNDVGEKELQRRFEKFVRVSSLELKNKKSGDGSVVSTFAFVDVVASDSSLQKCIQTLDGSFLKETPIRVQVAKESFLTRLQSERAESKTTKVPDRNSRNFPAQRPQEPYNPLELFKQRNSKKKFDEEDASPPVAEESEDVQESNSDEPGNVLTKLEKFSGIWNDLDSAPVVVDQKPSLQREDLPVETKKSTARAPQGSKDETVKVEDPKKKEMDNRKRIQSLQQRSEALKAQQNLIKSALSLSGSRNNNKIVFNEDDFDVPVKNEKATKPSSKTKTSLKLFDDEVDDEHEDYEENDKQFELRPHLEGKGGQQLLELQSRFAHDERFKLDKRFADDPMEVPEDDEVDVDTNHEKESQMAILSSLVPLAPANSSKKAKTIESTAFVRFDPSSKEHARYQKVREDPPLTEKSKKADRKRKHTSAETVAEVPVPEVSSDRYYTTTSNLNIGTSNNESFSLRKLFQSSEPEAEEPATDEPESQPKSNDQPDTTRKQKSQAPDATAPQPTSYWKNVGMWQEPLFLQEKDARLAESIEFLMRKPAEICYQDRSRWADERDRLIRFYKNKIRRLDSRLVGLKKRPLDAADQSDHFYSAQASAVAASKKPRQKFFHRKKT